MHILDSALRFLRLGSSSKQRATLIQKPTTGAPANEIHDYTKGQTRLSADEQNRIGQRLAEVDTEEQRKRNSLAGNFVNQDGENCFDVWSSYTACPDIIREPVDVIQKMTEDHWNAVLTGVQTYITQVARLVEHYEENNLPADTWINILKTAREAQLYLQRKYR